MVKEYILRPGDNFYGLSQRMGCTCDDFMRANPNLDPLKLQIGEKIVLPELKGNIKGKEQYADIRVGHGQEFAGDYLDDVEMEVEGVRFRLRRIGEPNVPHELHFILPRTEIRKVQPAGEGGPTELQIMISNLDIVLSPRLVSGDSAEQIKASPQATVQTKVQQQASQPSQPFQTPPQIPTR
ncbi:LysM domain-containing protein [Desulfosporosinus acidiphilus SJ4]|uniref:LysM domain-containing protein n=1 Tax=Desulfosporosinus acidiphilus (strain DSM 22704 / JCM 16185 / SJ4) TaxID=646529 RepID=I4D8Y1_DESAJ|nr:LysM domain-containing protein [Desulfosporosinus acidiphilus]AFM42255.1 LysM domain-containing protein [Desulfosporosinus acidiphilus SJ4]